MGRGARSLLGRGVIFVSSTSEIESKKVIIIGHDEDGVQDQLKMVLLLVGLSIAFAVTLYYSLLWVAGG